MRLAVGIVIGFICGVAIDPVFGTTRSERESTYAQLAVFARVLNHVQTSYVDQVAPEVLVRGALRGLVQQLDGHSRYVEPDAVAELRTSAPPSHIGLRLQSSPSGLEVADVHPEGPAARAGLRPGDVIQAIDGRTASELSPEAARAAMEGPPQTPVRLSVQHERGARDLELFREPLRPFTVRAYRSGTRGVVRIARFGVDTPLDVRRALDRVRGDGLDGLVLDLRDNPGGLVDAAARVADLWLTEGTIVTTEARGRVVEKLVAHAYGTEPNYPVIVLVNGTTASAAEIVAAALQEAGRAQVAGTRTFGKGTVQTVIDLEDGAALKLTIAHHFTPEHASIQGVGVVPDHPLTPPAIADVHANLGPQPDHELEAALGLLER